jgi:tellurium resistance protein TerZ
VPFNFKNGNFPQTLTNLRGIFMSTSPAPQSLTKIPKGAKLSLTKDGETTYTSIAVAAGWDPQPNIGTVDIDLSAVLFDDAKNVVDKVWFRDKKRDTDAIFSSGDNLTGEGDGDDETIAVKLDRIDPKVKSIVFALSSYNGQTFNQVNSAFARVVNTSGGKAEEKHRFEVAGMGKSTSLVLVKLYRHNGEWKINAIGDILPEITSRSTVNDAIDLIKSRYL